MALRLYSTLSRSLEEFRPLDEGKVRMYNCGPTVYDRAHIGNFRTFVFEDVLRRYLKWKGYDVIQVRNLTDVDDRTIGGALKAGVSLREFTQPFAAAFFEDSDRLGMERAEHYPLATDHLPEMVELVQKLIDRELAYLADGSVYFDISKFPSYGQLARLDTSGLREGERASGDDAYEKENARDFVLWKGGERPEEGDVAVWDSPWGPGRPGWHLECSALASSFLGQPFDIHSGGVDLIFPHHTNEIAQAEGATSKPFARYWIHANHMLIEGRKMSKSEGNFFTVADMLEKGFRPSTLRRLLTSSQYRVEFNFTLDGMDDAARSVERLMELRRRLAASGTDATGAPATRLNQMAERMLSSFETAMDDDLNVSEAWSALFVFAREVNTELDSTGSRAPTADVEAALAAVASIDRVLGVLALADLEGREVSDEQRTWIEAQLVARANARKTGDYAKADAIRDELAAAGVEVDDTSAGSRWRLVERG